MRVFRISGIGGLYHEFYDPDPRQLDTVGNVKNFSLDGTGEFWSAFFKQDRVESVVNALKSNSHAKLGQCPQYRAILADPQQFFERAINAPVEICASSCTPKHFFSCLETMTILCQLYSDFETAPFRLSLEEGYLLDDYSSDTLYQQSLHPQKNPYLPFVDHSILPVIKKAAPDILFLEGRLSHYLAAVAMRTRQCFPNVHICLTRHDSEYYSLNKITNFLKEDQILFHMVDSIVLEYFETTENTLIETLSTGKELKYVPNLLYQTPDGNIHETGFKMPSNCTQAGIYAQSAGLTVDIHLEPF